MKIKFDKVQNTKTDKNEDVKLFFSGSYNGLDIRLSLSGDVDLINQFKEDLNIARFGQQLDLEIVNQQQTLDKLNVEEDKNEN